MDEVTTALDVAANSMNLGGRGWKLLRRVVLPRLGTVRRPATDAELRSSITARDGTSWHFEARASDGQVQNALAIAKGAFEQIGSEDVPTDDLDEEWQDRFWDDAKRKYTEDARSVYASILAGELRHPGSVSKISLSVLDDLDQETARTFQRYCTLAARFGHKTALVHQPPDLDCMTNDLADFGVSYDDIGALAEHGLVRDDQSAFEAEPFVAKIENGRRAVQAYFTISDVAYALNAVPHKDFSKIATISATRTGNELARMIEPSTDVDVVNYTNKLFKEMESKGAEVLLVQLGMHP